MTHSCKKLALVLGLAVLVAAMSAEASRSESFDEFDDAWDVAVFDDLNMPRRLGRRNLLDRYNAPPEDDKKATEVKKVKEDKTAKEVQKEVQKDAKTKDKKDRR